MLYTEKEKHEIERVKEVFAEHLRQSPDFELDRKSTRLNSSHDRQSRMPSSA